MGRYRVYYKTTEEILNCPKSKYHPLSKVIGHQDYPRLTFERDKVMTYYTYDNYNVSNGTVTVHSRDESVNDGYKLPVEYVSHLVNESNNERITV